MKELYTIGHSNHPIEKFLDLLNQHDIAALCDVRSHPYSKYNPQFTYKSLKQVLKEHNIAYVFLGKELGGRTDDLSCYSEGKLKYARLAQTQIFQDGINRLYKGMASYRIALMCAEKEPVNCHRTILICRQLRAQDMEIKHILADGSIETQREIEQRLIEMLKIPQPDFSFEQIEQAYDKQSQKIAHVKNNYPNNSVQEVEDNYEQNSSAHDWSDEEDSREFF